MENEREFEEDKFHCLFLVSTRRLSRVVLDGEVLSADHSVSLEPFATELLGGTIGGVGPLDGHTVVVGVLSSKLEGVAGDGDQDGLLGVQDSAGRVHSKTLHVGRLEGPSDTTTARVGHLQKTEN